MHSSKQTLWLVKDDPEGEWYCNCEKAVVDAPWHYSDTYPEGGTGWLFTCTKCRLAFMFAIAKRIPVSLDALAEERTPRIRKTLDPATGLISEHVLLDGPEDWLKVVLPLAASLVEGKRYVFFDGVVLPAVHGPVCFKGLFREHDLPDLPHLSDPDDVLTSLDYWYPKASPA